jgi:outer membrane lipoprotein-sorting protein
MKIHCVLSFSMALGLSVQAAELSPQTSAWLSAQTNIQSWSAEFVQTRALKSLTQPTTENGRVWFVAPNRFRWELGTPAKTIAVRAPQEMLVVYPRLKRIERFPLVGEQAGPWREALALLEAGFPRSRTELQAQYQVLSETNNAEVCELVLQPRSAAARKMMPRIKIAFDLQKLSLASTELEFADHSTMRNNFRQAALNPTLDPKLFDIDFPADYTVVEPLKKR